MSIALLAMHCGGLSLCSESIFSAGCITFGSVSFPSILILFICTLLYILVNLSTHFIQLVVSLLLTGFHYLIPEVIFYGYGGGYHVSLGSGHDVPGLCHSNLIISLL